MCHFRDKWFTLCIKKEQYQNATKQDLPILPPPGSIPIELVYDGKILYDNLSTHTYNEGWLMAELKKRNLVVFDISYAVVGTKGNLYIDLIKDQSRE